MLTDNILQLHPLQVVPDPLIRVQLGSIGGQLLQIDSLPSRASQKGFDFLAPVDGVAIPDHQQPHRDVGVLNEDVWEQAVQEGKVDTAKIKVFCTTPEYYDYHWMARPDLDQLYSEGFTKRIQAALLKLNPQEHNEILELFSTEKFIETNNDNYRAIEDVARQQGLIQ